MIIHPGNKITEHRNIGSGDENPIQLYTEIGFVRVKLAIDLKWKSAIKGYCLRCYTKTDFNRIFCQKNLEIF